VDVYSKIIHVRLNENIITTMYEGVEARGDINQHKMNKHTHTGNR
jgi:hypothetical protein